VMPATGWTCSSPASQHDGAGERLRGHRTAIHLAAPAEPSSPAPIARPPRADRQRIVTGIQEKPFVTLVPRGYSRPGSGTARPRGSPVELSGSGDADVVWTAPEVERVDALADRPWAGRAPTTHLPVRRYQARLARRGQRRNVARNRCELGRDPSDRVPRPPVVQAVSAAIGGRRGPRRRGQVERDVSMGRGPGVGSGR
jgi:hypothetical protein